MVPGVAGSNPVAHPILNLQQPQCELTCFCVLSSYLNIILTRSEELTGVFKNSMWYECTILGLSGN